MNPFVRLPKTISLPALALAAIISPAISAEQPKIGARPLTPQEIKDYALPAETQVSGGLFTVGIGQPVYLEALANKGAVATNVAWALTSKPAGSAAVLAPSPLGPQIPMYTPGDRELHDLAGRQLLVPDKPGQYTVQVTMATATNTLVVTNHVTAGTYVGVGSLGGDPKFPQCVICHSGPWIRPDTVTPWSKTGHASFFTKAIDGLASSHYNAGCIPCHTLGYDTSVTATNGGFDDIAKLLGWTFPAVLQTGNWGSMSNELKNVANIQCENCHGPGSEHGWSGGNPNLISVSFSAGDCAQCHDDPPYHIKNQEWNNSRHAIATFEPTGEGREACVGCHSGVGFIDRMNGKPQTEYRTDYEAITCAACHDPHDATHPHQLRRVADVTLMNSTVITLGGQGKLCMNCHMSRRNGPVYADTTPGSSRFGPHHGPQTDMLAGTNAVNYGKAIPSSGHLFVVKDSCVTCHLQATAASDPARGKAGGHTFKPSWDAGTTNTVTDDVHLVGGCIQCHGPIVSFDIARYDYDGDGIIEGTQTEVEGLLHELALMLPPVGEPTVSITASYTLAQRRAAYNYLFVEEDGSKGIHNPAYAVGLLKASIADLKAAGNPDTDQDGLPDAWETNYFGSITAQTGDSDPDGDTLNNAFECALGTNPNLKDTDGDGYNDDVELLSSNDPTNANDNPTHEVNVCTAAELEFASKPGKTYRIQAVSPMGGGWQDVGEPIVGTGDMIQRLISTRTRQEGYYRIVELP